VKIALASDHAGFALKEHLRGWIGKEHDVTDFGTRSDASCDFPDFAHPAAMAVAEHTCDRAVIVDGAGYPSGIVANKIHGVYAAVCHDTAAARLSREHSDTNVLCLGAMVIGQLLADEIVKVWLATAFAGGRYATRVEKVKALESQHLLPRWQRPRDVITLADLRAGLLDGEGLVVGPATRVTASVRDLVSRP